jgi:RNA polymerase sigma-B factor
MGQALAAPIAEADQRTLQYRASGDRRLFERYREEGDLTARAELVERFLPLAYSLARRFWWGRDHFDDLVQVASVGLVKAIDRFDHERGIAFSSFAVPTILGELKRHFRDTRWALHVPQRLQERVIEVERAAEGLRLSLGRTPTIDEVADQIGGTAAGVAEAVEAASAFETVSLDGRSGPDHGDGAALGDALGFEDERFDLVEYDAAIQPALAALPSRERLILHMRFQLDMTQSEIAERLGMSQMHVSRLLRRTLGRVRTVVQARAA